MSVSTNTANWFETGSQNRVLVICVIVSILAHAALLLLFPGMRQGPPAASAVTVLTATLSSRNAAPPPAAAEAPRPPEPERLKPQVKPAPEPPRPVLTRPETSPAPAATPRVAEPAPAPPPPVQTATAPPSVPQAPSNVPRAPEVQAPTVTPASPSPPQATPGQSDATDEKARIQYGAGMVAQLRSFQTKYYPSIAREKGWTGESVVRLAIGRNGMTESTTVIKSSGYDVLDRAAIEMVTRAKPLVQIPPALKGKEILMSYPIVWNLKD